MSAGFTPGRWQAVRCGPAAPLRWNVQAQLGKNEYGIETIRTIDQVLDYCGAEEAKANAHLIAAAPALYEALERVVAHAISYGDFEGSGAHTAALAALAQARGDLVDPLERVKL